MSGQTFTNATLPTNLWVEGTAPSAAAGDVVFRLNPVGLDCPQAGTGCDRVVMTAVRVELPYGDVPGENNTFTWYANGLFGDRFQVLPDPLNVEVFWFLSGLPMDANTKVRWDPWDFINSRRDVGYGTSPDLEVTYEDLLSQYDDDMPPNNDWFGEKSVTVTVQGNTCAIRSVWFFFYVQAVRNNFDGSKMAAWYHYWKDGAVPALTTFVYDHNLPDLAQHRWNPFFGDKYYIGFGAWTGVEKPVFDVVAGTYTETPYPDYKGVGIHGVAKLCAHEQWHGVLEKETRSVLLGGYGHTDTDGDGLSDAREDEIGTDPTVKDTCNLSSYTGADYSVYVDYADQELFCRWKQEGILGDESKDWSIPGMQSHNQP